MKKTLLSLIMLTALVAFAAAQAEAADSGSVSVTVTMTKVLAITVAPNWAIGNVVEGAVKDTTTEIGGPDYFTVTNTSNASCNLTTTVADSGEGWTFAVNPGANAFAMDHSINQGVNWTQIELVGTILKSGLAAQTNQKFDLKFYAPASTTFGGVAQSIPVTITAS